MKGFPGACLLLATLWLPGLAGANEPIPVEAFARFNTITSPRLSPDGKLLALSTDLGHGQHALQVFRVDGMERTSILRFPKYEMPVQIRWVGNTRLVIAKGRKAGSLEKPEASGEIIATDFDGKNQTYVYGYEGRTAAGLDRGFGYIVGVPDRNDGHFYMRQLSFQTRRSMVYDVDSTKPSFKLVADIDVPDLDFTMDHAGRARFAYGENLDGETVVYRADDHGRWARMNADARGNLWIPTAFSSDDTQAYGVMSANGGPTKLIRTDAKGEAPQVLAEDAFASIGPTEWTAATSQPFAVRTGTGIGQMHYLPTASDDAQILKSLYEALPGRRIEFIDQSRDGRIILLSILSDRDPGGWYLYRRDTRKVERLFRSMDGIDPARMAERRSLRFKAGDGKELEAILTVPAGTASPRNLPMVLVPHGGPHGVADDWSFDRDAQFIASRGYLVLQVNFRGSGGRGQAFEEAGYRQWGTRIQDDLIDGVRWAIAEGMANPERICAYGGSFGAYSSLMIAAKAPGLLQCTVGLAGIYDLDMMYSKGDIQQREYGRRYLSRAIGKDASSLAAQSPVNLAANIRIPVLLAHGEDDQRAPIAQAKAMRAALTAAGHPPQWISYPDEGHGFDGEQNQAAFYQSLATFLAQHLGPASQ